MFTYSSTAKAVTDVAIEDNKEPIVKKMMI